MNRIDEKYLQAIINELKVLFSTTDRSEYIIPSNKLLLLHWGTEANKQVTNIAHLMVQDGAGVHGDQQLLELADREDIVFDAYFDDCLLDLTKRLKLIDNPFT